jgi:protein-S-isoprenylcysteine O-methyltransferase Ste14
MRCRAHTDDQAAWSRERACAKVESSGSCVNPVYGGAILIGLGWSFADAPLGLVPTALLAVLIDLKAQREETWLIERFPEYALYRARTPRRFVPWLY